MTNVNAFDVRIDEYASEKDHIFCRYSWSHSPSFAPPPFTGYADGGNFNDGAHSR